MNKNFIFLSILILCVFVINYPFLNSAFENFLSDSKTVHIERIIDGDTVVTSDNVHIRLLGINTPEKREYLHDEAENFLSEKILGKNVSLEFGKQKTDRYNRTLAYIFLGIENVNLESVENGFSNYYFPQGKDPHYNEFYDAWTNCIKDNTNLCEKSSDKCSQCIQLKELNVDKQEAIFQNVCSFSCNLTNWNIKDEGRKNFFFPEFNLEGDRTVTIKVGNKTDTNSELFWDNPSYVWTKTGDTLFLRDSENKLVLWETY